MPLLRGCDTFVAFPPAAPDGKVVFGKNSDRPAGETQSIRRYPRAQHAAIPGGGEPPMLRCTYVAIPQVEETHAVLVSQIDWMWGAEHGANEKGVVIGNEAVWTRAHDEPLDTERLLGMDLVRLGLERGATAREALGVITSLLETHGQGGPCAQDDPSFTYHNSFLIVDGGEAWVLETAGRQWVAQRTTRGSRNISNTLTIRTDYELSSEGLHQYAQTHGLLEQSRDREGGNLDWALCFGDGCVEECESPFSRQYCGRKLLETHAEQGTLNPSEMMKILRNHKAGICMHGGFETTASMVSELAHIPHGTTKTQAHRHWMMEVPHPCQNEYTEQHYFKTAS